MIKFFKKRWYLIIIAGVLVAVFFFLRNSKQAADKKSKPYKVKKETLREILALSGEVSAEEKTTLRFQSSGKLIWVGVKEGDYVKKYQGVASLDKRELEMNLKKYLNTYSKSRWDFEQTKEDKSMSKIGNLDEDARREAYRILDKAQFDLNNAVLDVELKDLALQFSYLYSPIEGLVTKVGAPYAGVNVTPAQSEIEIVNPKTIYLSATADQTEVVKLTKGLKGKIIIDAYDEESVAGTVTGIAFTPKTGETGTVYEVKITLNKNNDDYKYRLGMTGDVEFVLKEKPNAMAVPTNYIKTDNGQNYVWKSSNGKKLKQVIQIGEEIDGSTEIISGLTNGDIIYD